MESTHLWSKSWYLKFVYLGWDQQTPASGLNIACCLLLYCPGAGNSFYIFKGLQKNQEEEEEEEEEKIKRIKAEKEKRRMEEEKK